LKKWLIRIGVVVAVLVVAAVAIGFLLPTTYEVSQSIVINAPRDRVHLLIADLEQWPKWEPWSNADTSINTTVGVQTTGVGATQSWTDQHGGGELTFTMSDPDKGIAYDLTFSEKFHCKAAMLHEGEDGEVTVTWTMNGDAAEGGIRPVAGYFAQLMPGIIQPMFADGLQRLKSAAETSEQVQ